MPNDLTCYNSCKDQMKSMDALAYKSNEPIGEIIRIFSPGWNHAGLFIPMDRHNGYECRNWTLEAVHPKVHLTLLSKKLESYNGEVWWFPLKPEYDDLRILGERYVLEFEGVKYDLRGLLRNALGWVSMNAFQMFCSELDFFGYREMGIVHGNVAPRPSNLFTDYPIFCEPKLLVKSDEKIVTLEESMVVGT